ncbi:CAAX prenyl protease 1 homolog [Uranotaenia lowii]|uniref:LOW QUALITY PROTEIN: CAAX prenyl protease 1 homolog n=1 Tax=Uranotaenia lowii TaxID=190385 RepID=UPI00247911FF|nr:LOW QUALITY PROTEIN: CAAX prenyl protease 1 homolog [Uranotaenia lowii]XP_055609851.1 CAAX prenyl protease 1 homolog [Uranotaenia lowii]
MLEELKTSELTLYSILIFLIVENLVNLYLTRRQIYVYQTSKEVPVELRDVMTKETFEKARLYGLDKANYEVFKLLVCDIAISTLEIYSGFIAKVWARATEFTDQFGLNTANEIHVSIVFLILINIIGTFKDLPFKIYATFVLEEKHGFNKQTPTFFLKDQIKSFLIGQLLSVPIVAAIVYIVQIGGDYFFIWLWAFVGMVSLVLITIYPVYIAPLFDKFRPLEDGELKTSIENLAASLKFPLGKLFVVEGSKRSAHSNAYFTGLFGAKRIVLFDTLLLNKGLPDDETLTNDEKGKGCENKEVLAVLAHELGHWKLGHIKKNIIIMQVQMFLIFMAFSQLFKYSPLYQAVGFPENVQPILIGFLVIVMYVLAPYNTVISFAMTILSRRFEYQADEFALGLGYSKELGKALIKLHIDNLGFPIYDWMYSSWNHSHPTLLQRLERLKVDANKKQR